MGKLGNEGPVRTRVASTLAAGRSAPFALEVAGLSNSGELAIHCAQPSDTAHVIIDVNGYFE
jgi:hypothetical protein